VPGREQLRGARTQCKSCEIRNSSQDQPSTKAFQSGLQGASRVDPERIDPKCPKTNKMSSKTLSSLSPLERSAQSISPSTSGGWRRRLARRTGASRCRCPTDPLSYPRLGTTLNEKRIDFVPHATNEVGVHKVKVVATLNSKITANNQTKIEQEIEVTVVASNYPSVQTTVNQIEVEIFYD